MPAPKVFIAYAPTARLNQAGRAQLGNDEEQRRYRPRDDDASIEDPLRDWPENSPS